MFNSRLSRAAELAGGAGPELGDACHWPVGGSGRAGVWGRRGRRVGYSRFCRLVFFFFL